MKVAKPCGKVTATERVCCFHFCRKGCVVMFGATRGSFRFDLEVEIGDGQRWSINWSNSSGHQGIGLFPVAWNLTLPGQICPREISGLDERILQRKWWYRFGIS